MTSTLCTRSPVTYSTVWVFYFFSNFPATVNSPQKSWHSNQMCSYRSCLHPLPIYPHSSITRHVIGSDLPQFAAAFFPLARTPSVPTRLTGMSMGGSGSWDRRVSSAGLGDREIPWAELFGRPGLFRAGTLSSSVCPRRLRRDLVIELHWRRLTW